jgi:hypothetical protein
VFCENTNPAVRLARGCTARAILPTAAGQPAPTCLNLESGLVAAKSRKRVRRFISGGGNIDHVDLKLKFNDAAGEAIVAAFTATGQSSILVCVEFQFESGPPVTITRELILLPNGRFKTRLPQTTRSSRPAAASPG